MRKEYCAVHRGRMCCCYPREGEEEVAGGVRAALSVGMYEVVFMCVVVVKVWINRVVCVE